MGRQPGHAVTAVQAAAIVTFVVTFTTCVAEHGQSADSSLQTRDAGRNPGMLKSLLNKRSTVVEVPDEYKIQCSRYAPPCDSRTQFCSTEFSIKNPECAPCTKDLCLGDFQTKMEHCEEFCHAVDCRTCSESCSFTTTSSPGPGTDEPDYVSIIKEKDQQLDSKDTTILILGVTILVLFILLACLVVIFVLVKVGPRPCGPLDRIRTFLTCTPESNPGVGEHGEKPPVLQLTPQPDPRLGQQGSPYVALVQITPTDSKASSVSDIYTSGQRGTGTSTDTRGQNPGPSRSVGGRPVRTTDSTDGGPKVDLHSGVSTPRDTHQGRGNGGIGGSCIASPSEDQPVVQQVPVVDRLTQEALPEGAAAQPDGPYVAQNTRAYDYGKHVDLLSGEPVKEPRGHVNQAAHSMNTLADMSVDQRYPPSERVTEDRSHSYNPKLALVGSTYDSTRPLLSLDPMETADQTQPKHVD